MMSLLRFRFCFYREMHSVFFYGDPFLSNYSSDCLIEHVNVLSKVSVQNGDFCPLHVHRQSLLTTWTSTRKRFLLDFQLVWLRLLLFFSHHPCKVNQKGTNLSTRQEKLSTIVAVKGLRKSFDNSRHNAVPTIGTKRDLFCRFNFSTV